MNSIEKKLILDLLLDKMPEENFYEAYPVNLHSNPDYFLKVLEEAYEGKNSEEVEYGLMIAQRIDTIDKYHSILQKLILENWHNQHENIVDILTRFKDKTDAKYFYHVLKSKYDYITDIEDFLVPIWVKCVWALGKINTPEAKEYLTEFKNSEYKDVKEAVAIQFKKNGWT